ncbi:hypothetical protein [Cellulomonas sp. URHD0024]|uniref:hypothetical protein n=1 Tax=Cellulomonas sp. URHD0024 TaxID=1302620 RepID=UPI0003FB5731|nr:hypothetical protein [Cellulomonas sp. URHD0024]
MRNRQITTGAATATAILVAALVGACSAPGPDPDVSTTTAVSPSRASTPTPSLDPTIAAAQAAILRAYQGYWDAKVAAFSDPTKDPGPELETFAVDKAFADVASSVFTFRGSGIQVTGEPILHPSVAEIVTGSEGSAKIVDCVDGTNWQPIYTATGKSAAAPGQEPRLVTTSTAYFYVDHWTIRTSNVDRNEPC